MHDYGDEEVKQISPEETIELMIMEIEQAVQDSGGQLWIDSQFPADDSSLYLDPMGKPPDYADETPNVEWKRPHEILKNTEQKPMMMKDGFSPGDVK